ncbi:hypothetical protein IWX63_003358, partial [Arthrobacter sp. CAN_A2]|uniref:hypothetical protein n=1 Tax=Arthrobacter sp. CAN_A2 TaxID=2787718 RepID=UPI001A213FF7
LSIPYPAYQCHPDGGMTLTSARHSPRTVKSLFDTGSGGKEFFVEVEGKAGHQWAISIAETTQESLS